MAPAVALPARPRATVFDLFGDYVRYVGGEIRLSPLTDLLSTFGIGPSTVRVAMSRLRNEGWFDTHRTGRETCYALNDRSWGLLDEGRARIFQRRTEPWDGYWRMVIYSVPESDRAARDRVRKRLTWFGFGALAPSTWVCTHERLEQVEGDLSDETAVRLDLFTCRTRGPEDDKRTAARCWDLPALDTDYRNFLNAYRPRLCTYAKGLAGQEALLERTRLVQAYRRLPYRDPDLPAELLPTDWSGGAAHRLFLQAHDLLQAPAEEFFAHTVGLTEEAFISRRPARRRGLTIKSSSRFRGVPCTAEPAQPDEPAEAATTPSGVLRRGRSPSAPS